MDGLSAESGAVNPLGQLSYLSNSLKFLFKNRLDSKFTGFMFSLVGFNICFAVLRQQAAGGAL